MPFGAWETGVSRTTSAGLRVMAGAACDIQLILHTAAAGAPLDGLRCPQILRWVNGDPWHYATVNSEPSLVDCPVGRSIAGGPRSDRQHPVVCAGIGSSFSLPPVVCISARPSPDAAGDR